MKSLNLTAKDLEKSLPCSIGLLTSRNPIFIEGTSVFESEIEHARTIPTNKRRLLSIKDLKQKEDDKQ